MTPQIAIRPADAHNEQLVANVHPVDWKNPIPQDRYNLVVIGAGSAGLITAAIAAGPRCQSRSRRAPLDGRGLSQRRMRTFEELDPSRPHDRRGAPRRGRTACRRTPRRRRTSERSWRVCGAFEPKSAMKIPRAAIATNSASTSSSEMRASADRMPSKSTARSFASRRPSSPPGRGQPFPRLRASKRPAT